ncbi:MAG: ImmA/IrrE family metallo-endopeptidase [Clostridia bacterium]|nr:ImmA/IrrE family metallo-endopeptidase [Clostridia bacterium]MDD4048317.1 ImmA/IrrE family metallo-endopeptidase [Clostridia bacterium]
MKEVGGIIQDKANLLRQQYNLGNYCGRSIFDIIEKLEIENSNPLLFRLPFKNNELAGFVGYKNNRFAIYTNTNKTLGYEIFTAAHEIYHIVENRLVLKKNIVLQEEFSEEQKEKTENSEILADIFAAELLMPETDIKKEYHRLLNKYRLSTADESIIVMLQQIYFVEYKAVTKRLREIGANNYNKETENQLNRILLQKNDLPQLTKRLGYSSDLNELSKTKVYLPKVILSMIKENYQRLRTSHDDLIVLFSYAGVVPEYFGYEEDEELSDVAKTLEEKLKIKLGSDRFGKK